MKYFNRKKDEQDLNIYEREKLAARREMEHDLEKLAAVREKARLEMADYLKGHEKDNKYKITKVTWEIYHILLCIGVWIIAGIMTGEKLGIF